MEAVQRIMYIGPVRSLRSTRPRPAEPSMRAPHGDTP
jgi:hypothetical protein